MKIQTSNGDNAIFTSENSNNFNKFNIRCRTRVCKGAEENIGMEVTELPTLAA
jgi:hypothetical protein